MTRFSLNRSPNAWSIRLLAAVPALLAIATIIVLLTSLPDPDLLVDYRVELAVYAFLTGIALFFAVLLTEGELSPAHVVGMMALLALPREVRPATLWAIFAGGLGGGLALIFRDSARPAAPHHMIHTWRNLVYTVGRVTLSFYAAGQIYVAAGGPLPLEHTTWNTNSNTPFLLVLYGSVYIAIYLSIFMLEIQADGRHLQQILRADVSPILVIMLLPVPFAILSAEISEQLRTPVELLSIFGLTVIMLGLHTLGLSEYRLRRQLNELRTLSVVTRAMRSHLNLDTLLKTVYLQVAHLLDINNFKVALVNSDQNRTEFPLVIRDGHEEVKQDDDTDLRSLLYSDPLIAQVTATGAPLLISRDVAAFAQSLKLPVPKHPISSWLGVPLLAGGRALGAISVTSSDPNRHFTQDDLRLLNIVAASASIAIENAQLYRQQTERVDQLATLNNIAGLLSGTLSPDTVVDTIISSASAISQANAVAVYLFLETSNDEKSDERLPFYVRSAGLSEAFATYAPRPLLFSEGSGTDGVPLHRRMPVAMSSITADKHGSALLEAMQREGKKALVEVPLAMGENGLGVIGLFYDEPQTFSGERLELLRTFATQAAQAINNARTFTVTDEAFQRSVEQLLSLAGIGRMLTSTIDLNTICDLVLTHATDSTRVHVGIVALVSQESAKLQVMAQRGYPDFVLDNDDTLRKVIGLNVLDSGQLERIDDTRKVPGYHAVLDATRAVLAVPILRGRDVLGFIALQSTKVSAFSEEDCHFVSQLANQAVIAIDNARLFSRITEARDRLQTILDAMDEAIILIDARGRIALANPRIEVLGLHADDLTNQPIADLVERSDLKLAQRLGFAESSELLKITGDLHTTDSWDGNEPFMFEVQHDSGTYSLQRYVIPVRDEQNQAIGALLVFYDRTEEQELARTREELSRMIVHDLRSPLTAVTTSFRLLTDIVPLESEYGSLVEKITDAGRRAIRKLLIRVDSLLDIARMESGRMGLEVEPTDLATLADNVSVELSPLAQELEIEITAQIDDDVPLLNVDRDKIERVLLNLVDNALKYSPTQSIVTICAHSPGTKGAPPRFVRVEVADRGPGIPPDYKDSLFESFVQVEGRKRVRRGVGLGLTFCKLVSEAHGGRIWIEDNPDGGSIFAFILPVADMTTIPEDQAEDDTHPVEG